MVGRNKLAPTYERGAAGGPGTSPAPRNAQRLGKKTPCAVKGDRCYDCKSPERICRGLVVLWGPMMGMETEVLLVDEDLGCNRPLCQGACWKGGAWLCGCSRVMLPAVGLLALTGCALAAGAGRTRTVEPHSSKFWESEAAGTLRAENYQDIVNDLLILIGQHTESATRPAL